MIIAVDFDGTLCEDKYPEIGQAYEDRIRFLKCLKTDPSTRLILWTCRNGDALQDAVRWCEEHDLHFDAVNCNLPEILEKWGGDTRKVFCDYYIDDKNISFLELAERCSI